MFEWFSTIFSLSASDTFNCLNSWVQSSVVIKTLFQNHSFNHFRSFNIFTKSLVFSCEVLNLNVYSSPSFLDFAFLKYPLLLQILEIIEMLIFNSIDAWVKLSKICFSFVPIFFEIIDLLLDLFWFSFGVRSCKVLILLFVLRLSLWSICNPFGIKPLKHSQTNRWIFYHICKLGNNHFYNLFLVSILVWF